MKFSRSLASCKCVLIFVQLVFGFLTGHWVNPNADPCGWARQKSTGIDWQPSDPSINLPLTIFYLLQPFRRPIWSLVLFALHLYCRSYLPIELVFVLFVLHFFLLVYIVRLSVLNAISSSSVSSFRIVYCSNFAAPVISLVVCFLPAIVFNILSMDDYVLPCSRLFNAKFYRSLYCDILFKLPDCIECQRAGETVPFFRKERWSETKKQAVHGES